MLRVQCAHRVAALVIDQVQHGAAEFVTQCAVVTHCFASGGCSLFSNADCMAQHYSSSTQRPCCRDQGTPIAICGATESDMKRQLELSVAAISLQRGYAIDDPV